MSSPPSPPPALARGPSPTARAGLGLARALVGRRFTASFAALRATLRMSADELRARQEERTRAIVTGAIERVPYWRDAARSLGMEAGDVHGRAELQRLPVVDKSVFRSRPAADFLAEGLPVHRQLPFTTSGSTGDPFRFVLDRRAMGIVFASHLFFDSWYDLDPFDRSVRIQGPPSAEPALPRGTPWRARLRAGATRRMQACYERTTQRRLSTLDASPERVQALLESFRPDYLLGYTATLGLLAAEFLRSGYRPSRPLRSVITIAETLTPERRSSIESCFGAPIANRYGQREFKFWCAQSPVGDPSRFLVHPELVVFETLDDAGDSAQPGATGRVVLTNLHNEVMPFLRYDTGDLATRHEPMAGSPFPVMGRLDGRTQELIAIPGGRTLDATTVGHMLFVVGPFADHVRLYQVVQDEPRRLRLRIAPRGAPADDLGPRLRTTLMNVAGPGVEVAVEFVDDIPLERSGKRPILKALRTPPSHAR